MADELAPEAVPDLPGPGDPVAPAAEPAKRGPGRPKGSGKRQRDAAPKAPPAPPRAPGRPSAIDKLGEQLAGQFAMLAMAVMMVNPTAGAIMLEDAPTHGQALAKLAEQNARVRKLLEGGLTGSAWIGVVAAFGGTAFKVNVALRAQASVSPTQPSAPASGDGNPLAAFLSGGMANGAA